jgi:hypothetical protein
MGLSRAELFPNQILKKQRVRQFLGEAWISLLRFPRKIYSFSATVCGDPLHLVSATSVEECGKWGKNSFNPLTFILLGWLFKF